MGRIKNKVFIAYSGVTSKSVALELRRVFENASDGQIGGLITSEDLAQGEQWATRIKSELDEAAMYPGLYKVLQYVSGRMFEDQKTEGRHTIERGGLA